MKETQINFVLEENAIRLQVQHEQFFDWLKKTFFLSEELQKKYNRFYQELFYVHVYQLVTEGFEYVKEILNTKSENSIDFMKYCDLKLGLEQIRNSFTEEEFELIEYQRHCSCHMLQNHYEYIIKKNNSVNTKRKGKNINELRDQFRDILNRHRNDSGFDRYFSDKLFPILKELYIKLQK